MWWGYHGFCFFPFGILFVLIIMFVIFRFSAVRGYGRCNRNWESGSADAEAILKRRLANGEISESEYQQLRDVLNRK